MRDRTLTKSAMAPVRLATRLADRTTRRSRAARRKQAPGVYEQGGRTEAAAGGSEPPVEGGVAAAVGPVHRDVARLAAWFDAGSASYADPRQIHHAGDAAVAAMCQHLATADFVVYPDLVRVLPHAAGTVARLRAGAREMQPILRGVQQIAAGDTYAPGTVAADLHGEFSAAISEHGQIEEDLLREYDEAAPAWRRERLVAEYERMLPRAPSRPHPYLFGRGPFAGRLGSQVLGRWDKVLDIMDSREVPWAPVREPDEVGPWGAWLLGRPPRTADHRADSASAPARRPDHA